MRSLDVIFRFIKANFSLSFTGVVFVKNLYSICNFNFSKTGIAFSEAVDDDINDAARFYNRTGRTYIDEEYIRSKLEAGQKLFIVRDNGTIIGANWVFYGKFALRGNSKYTLMERNQKELSLPTGYAYSCYVIVDKEYRGQGIYNCLCNYVFNSLKDNFDYLLIQTNTNNKTMMHLCDKYYDLAAIIKVKTCMTKLIHKEVLYADKNMDFIYRR